jgi:hypothetical protein
MIDIQKEELLTLAMASRQSLLPKRRNGKRPHVATLYRWAQRGVRGVRLETIRVGGTLCTTVSAIQRFCDALSRTTDFPPPPVQCSQNSLKACEALNELGI